jgi:hypothetical protein
MRALVFSGYHFLGLCFASPLGQGERSEVRGSASAGAPLASINPHHTLSLAKGEATL